MSVALRTVAQFISICSWGISKAIAICAHPINGTPHGRIYLATEHLAKIHISATSTPMSGVYAIYYGVHICMADHVRSTWLFLFRPQIFN
jgi:hypothetical protein